MPRTRVGSVAHAGCAGHPLTPARSRGGAATYIWTQFAAKPSRAVSSITNKKRQCKIGSLPVWCPEADISLERCATSAHERKESGGGRRGNENRGAQRRGVDAVLGDEKKPRKKDLERPRGGRERPIH